MRAVRACAFGVLLAACGAHDDAEPAAGSSSPPPADAPSTASPLPFEPRSVIARGEPAELPLILSLPPPLDVAAPNGVDGPAVVAKAGIGYFKTGATSWTSTTLATEQAWQAKAASLGVKTWVNLGDLTGAEPGTAQDMLLASVVTALRGSSGLGLWKGADEPFWGKRTPQSLAHAFSVVKALDPDHDLVTIQAPKPDTAAGLPAASASTDLAPYEAVTDVHGVDVYPVAYGDADPDLHRVGAWTQAIVKATPTRPVIAALQICFSGSDDPAGSGAFVMPTLRQERYMIYDAIMNGARGLSFFGGTVATCLTGDDKTRGFNWRFWDDVLAPLVGEIGPNSPVHPALLAYGTGLGLTTDDPLTQVMSRRVAATGDVWVFTARRGATPATLAVEVSGLPKTLAHAEVMGEGRTIDVKDGAFTDDHARWDVHVYRVTE